MAKELIIYTDGGCEGNPGPGGWAAVLLYGSHRREVSGGEPATTNNRMELRAAIGALEILKQRCKIELHTDSQYLREGITNWLHGWKRNGWRTRDKKAVKNADLWRRLDQLSTEHEITWKWLKGHAGHEHNERCDVLACAQAVAARRAHTPAQLQELLGNFKRSRDAGEPGTPELAL